MIKILVTGSLGVIGSALTKELRQRNYDVFGCDLAHQPDEVSFSLSGDIENPSYVRCDISNFRQIESVIKKLGPFDYIYNCAAEFGRWNGEDFYEQLWTSNVIGTKNIIRLQELFGFKLIHFSSSEVYGDWPDIMVETVMDRYEVRQLNDYAMTKWVNEMQIHNSAIGHNTKSVIVRIFNTYGPGEYYSPYRSVICRFLYCALHNLGWTVYKNHYRTSTYLADSVRTLANIANNFKPGEIYNIGGDQLHSIEGLSNLVLEISGADSSLVKYEDTEPLTTKVKQVDVSKASRDLDHKNTYLLKDGLNLTFEWMKQVYKGGEL